MILQTPQLRLFCFAHAGASCSMYAGWLSCLPNSIALQPVELPGRGARISEPALQCLDLLVRELAGGLLPLTDKPFAFFGHSLGALISYELARYIKINHGRHPVRLFVSAFPAPHCRSSWMPVHDIPEADLCERLRALGGTPDEALQNPELMHLIMPALRADFAMYEDYAYRPGELLSCPISAFGGLDDPTMSPQETAAWREHTRAGFVCHILPGDHFFINVRRREVIAAILDDLAVPSLWPHDDPRARR